MDIAGEQVTVTSSGLAAAGQSTGSSLPISSINTLLGELGISLSMTNATDTVSGPSASRTLDGLKITIDLKTLDAAANTFATLLPASLTSQLPVALPNEQQLTLDLATVQVSSTASPSFAAGNSGNSGAGSTSSAGASPSAVTSADTGNSGSAGFTGTTGTGGTFSGGTSGGSTPSGSAAGGAGGPTTAVSAPASVIAPAFKGIGAALVLLGLLAASALAYAYRRADEAGELLGTSCADGDPLMERFTATPDDLTAFGGTT